MHRISLRIIRTEFLASHTGKLYNVVMGEVRRGSMDTGVCCWPIAPYCAAARAWSLTDKADIAFVASGAKFMGPGPGCQQWFSASNHHATDLVREAQTSSTNCLAVYL